MYVCRVDGEAKLTFFYFQKSLINANLPWKPKQKTILRNSLPTYFNLNFQ